MFTKQKSYDEGSTFISEFEEALRLAIQQKAQNGQTTLDEGQISPELRAMDTIYRLLDRLDSKARLRILSWALHFFLSKAKEEQGWTHMKELMEGLKF
jgi:hypothetical protein